MCLHLPRWPTNRLVMGRPSPESAAPLVLYEKTANALRIYALNKEADALGLRRGQALTDARAMAPELIAQKADPEADEQAFWKLCDWHSRYSPFVAPLAPSNILLDITGAAHLFGGEESLLDEALGKLHALGVEACGAIADSVGAAWAGSHMHRRLIIRRKEEKRMLENLPVAALRLEDAVNENLKRLGLKKIGQLYDKPRALLASRFGDRLNDRLDQALALAPEPLKPMAPPPDYSASCKLAEPILETQSVIACLHSLALEVQEALVKDSKGGRRFELSLYRVDNAVMRVKIGTSAPAQEAKHLVRLFANKLGDVHHDLDSGFGFEALRLSAFDCDPVTATQRTVFTSFDTQEGSAALFDRLSNRLGSKNVVRMLPIDSHLPERAIFYSPVLCVRKPTIACAPLKRQRPLRLLPRPESIQVMAAIPDGPPIRFEWRRVSYIVAKASDPERIEDEWWREQSRPARDYYRVETVEGRRFWIFRAGFYVGGEAAPEWRLHGFFA